MPRSLTVDDWPLAQLHLDHALHYAPACVSPV